MREHVAEEVRALLGRQKISGSELARRLGFTQRYMSRRLTGETPFDIDDLEKVAKMLNVEVADLLPRRNEGRLITTSAQIGHSTKAFNDRSATRPERTAPPGHPNHHSPHDATRRPARNRPVGAH